MLACASQSDLHLGYASETRYSSSSLANYSRGIPKFCSARARRTKGFSPKRAPACGKPYTPWRALLPRHISLGHRQSLQTLYTGVDSLTPRASPSNSRSGGESDPSSASLGPAPEAFIQPAQDSNLNAKAPQERRKAWQEGWRLLQDTARTAWPLAWQLLVLFAICDGLNFLLVRVCHRITNEVALRYLLPGIASRANIGQSLWYLTSNPEISNFRTGFYAGYLWVSGLMLVVMLPLNILLRTIAVSISQLMASSSRESKAQPDLRPPVKQIWGDLKSNGQQVSSALSRLWKVDILVALRALPLQGLCLLVLPLPWALPRLVNLQFASPLALFEGKAGKEAVVASTNRIQKIRKRLTYPFIGLLLTARLVAISGETFFVRILSPRIAKEIPEIPLAVFLTVSLTTLALNRLSDLLPYVAYRQESGTEKHPAEASLPVEA